MSPRQKMINLMYIVLTAMLALNVSSDVLNGFSQVEDGLTRSNRTSLARNQAMVGEIEAFTAKYPAQGKPILDQARQVRQSTQQLYDYIDTLKLLIVRAADGPTGRVDNIQSQDNLDAAGEVMLAPVGTKRATQLKARITDYRNQIVSQLADPQKQQSVLQALATNPPRNSGGKSWEESLFENMPTIAAVTLLTKIQGDLLFSEGVVLNNLLTNLDTGDLRVNSVQAFVVPDSRIVMRGTKYSAHIVMAAIDTLHRPTVYVGGSRISNPDGLYQVTAGAVGTHEFSGYIEMVGRDGTITKRDFKSSYTVIEPMASISATMMNVFYAGIDNPVSISVSGVPQQSIQASMTNGTLTKSGDHWIARSSRVGSTCEISVTAEIDGNRTSVGSMSFRVRKLPDPTPYIAYGDNRYKGGRPFPKGSLLAAHGVDAAIDDDLLDIKYNVVSFECVFFDSMGNAMPELSAGSHFSERQRTAIKRLQHGKRFYITRVKASGPDGITRDISPMEVIIN